MADSKKKKAGSLEAAEDGVLPDNDDYEAGPIVKGGVIFSPTLPQFTQDELIPPHAPSTAPQPESFGGLYRTTLDDEEAGKEVDAIRDAMLEREADDAKARFVAASGKPPKEGETAIGNAPASPVTGSTSTETASTGSTSTGSTGSSSGGAGSNK